MTWKKAKEPLDQLVTVRYSKSELAQVAVLMKKENISKSEAIRRLSFPAEEGAS